MDLNEFCRVSSFVFVLKSEIPRDTTKMMRQDVKTQGLHLTFIGYGPNVVGEPFRKELTY